TGAQAKWRHRRPERMSRVRWRATPPIAVRAEVTSRKPTNPRTATVRRLRIMRRPLACRHMAWDFSTEPEFEEKLEWMRGFVRDEIIPLETLGLPYERIEDIVRPLQQQVKDQGLWAAHLEPELGGGGFGQV